MPHELIYQLRYFANEQELLYLVTFGGKRHTELTLPVCSNQSSQSELVGAGSYLQHFGAPSTLT